GASATGHAYGIRFWEIGNELYGDGTYTEPFEYTDPATRTKGPAAYAQGVVQFSQTMKMVDNSIKIGAVFTMPGNNPDDTNVAAANKANGTNLPLWDTTLLNTPGFCNAIDFASVHWYAQQPKNPGPGAES